MSGSSRRRRGPAFLPSEHDELPPGVAFMVSPRGRMGPAGNADSSFPFNRVCLPTKHLSQPSTSLNLTACS